MKTLLSMTVSRIAVIFSLTIITTIAVSLLHPHGLDLILSSGQPPGMPKGMKSEILFVSVNEIVDELLRLDYIFLDIRDEAEYKLSHPKIAVNIPYHDFENNFDLFSGNIGADARFCIMCEGVLCGMSLRAARSIRRAGFEHVVILKQSFEDWKDRGLPVDGEPGEDYASGNRRGGTEK